MISAAVPGYGVGGQLLHRRVGQPAGLQQRRGLVASVACVHLAGAGRRAQLGDAAPGRRPPAAPVSTAASSSAARRRWRRPIGRYASIARRCTRSSSSSRLGRRAPAATIAVTAAPAAAVVGKTATRVSDSARRAGRSATVISVMMPSVPSEPTKSRVRS